MSEAAVASGPAAPEDPRSLARRLLRIAAWLVGLLILNALLQLVGVDIIGWLEDLWDSVTDISLVYVLLGCLFQGTRRC